MSVASRVGEIPSRCMVLVECVSKSTTMMFSLPCGMTVAAACLGGLDLFRTTARHTCRACTSCMACGEARRACRRCTGCSARDTRLVVLFFLDTSFGHGVTQNNVHMFYCIDKSVSAWHTLPLQTAHQWCECITNPGYTARVALMMLTCCVV